MEITYQNTKEDLLAYYEHGLSHLEEWKAWSKQTLIRHQVATVCLALVVGALIVVFTASQSLVKSVGIFGTSLVLAEILFFIVTGFEPRHSYAKDLLEKQIKSLARHHREKTYWRPITCTINEQQIEIRRPGSYCSWEWHLVEHVDITTQHIFLIVDTKYVFIIPKRAFASDEDFLAFARAALNYKNSAESAWHLPTVMMEEETKVPVIPPKKHWSKLTKLFFLLLALSLSGIFCCIAVAGTAWKEGAPSIQEAHAVFDQFMKAMAAKDVDSALQFFVEPTETLQRQLQKQIQSTDASLYVGYLSSNPTSWHLNTNLQNDEAQAQISGTIRYQSGASGIFEAILRKKNGSWKIVRFAVYASPQQIEWFLESENH